MPAERPLTIHCAGPWPARPDAPALHAGDGGIHLFFATLGQLGHRISPYLKLLDGDEQARADRFRHAHDRERFILGHGLLRELLGRQLHQPPEGLVLLRGEFGKPYLEGHPVHFNLSDTKDAVLVALADEPIGADLETMNRTTDHDRVAGHYFTPPEVESIEQAVDGKRRFLELWTRKEAVLKACGVGLMDDLHSLNVGGTLNRMVIRHPDFMRLAAPEYHVQTLAVGPDHIVSLACASVIRHWHMALA